MKSTTPPLANKLERRVLLYDRVDDALCGEDGLVNYLQKCALHSPPSWQTWLVAPTRSATLAIKNKLLETGTPLLNFHFVEPQNLRQLFSAFNDSKTDIYGKDLLKLALNIFTEKYAAKNAIDERESALLKSRPKMALQALDDLASLLVQTPTPNSPVDELCAQRKEQIKNKFRRYLPTMLAAFACEFWREDSPWSPPNDDFFAIKAQNRVHLPLNLVLFHIEDAVGDITILKTACALAGRARVYIPQASERFLPREENWRELFCEFLDVEAEILPTYINEKREKLEGDSNKNSIKNAGNEWLCEMAMTGFSLLPKPEASPAEFAICANEYSHNQRVKAILANWLKANVNSPKERLAIIFPGNCPAAVEIANFCEQNALAWRDDLGVRERADFNANSQLRIIRFLEEGRVENFLAVLNALVVTRSNFELPDLELSQKLFAKAWDATQNPNAKGLLIFICENYVNNEKKRERLAGDTRVENCARKLCELCEVLQLPTQASTIVKFVEDWLKLCELLGIDAPAWDLLLPKLMRLEESLATARQSRSFVKVEALNFLKEVLRLEREKITTFKHNDPDARVVLTSLHAANAQTWSGTIFCLANAEAWPIKRGENPFLPDYKMHAALRELQLTHPENKFFADFSNDKFWQELTLFCNVLRNSAESPIFVGFISKEAEDEREWRAAHFADICAEICVAHFGENLQILLQAKTELKEPKFKKNLTSVNFDFRGLKEDNLKIFNSSWNATGISNILTDTRYFVLQNILHARPNLPKIFESSTASFIGSLAHKLLRKALSGDLEHEQCERRLRESAQVLARKSYYTSFSKSFFGELREAEQLAFLALENVLKLLEAEAGEEFAFDLDLEQDISGEMEDELGGLYLRARADILAKFYSLGDAEKKYKKLLLIDFKTGATFTVPGARTNPRNTSLQFPSYYYLARVKYCVDEIATYVLLPLQNDKSANLRVNEEYLHKANEVLTELAELQKRRLLPIVEKKRSEFEMFRRIPLLRSQ